MQQASADHMYDEREEEILPRPKIVSTKAVVDRPVNCIEHLVENKLLGMVAVLVATRERIDQVGTSILGAPTDVPNNKLDQLPTNLLAVIEMLDIEIQRLNVSIDRLY